MATRIKIPKEVLELWYEAAACHALADEHDKGWWPSAKAIYYRTKAVKATYLRNRALQAAHPATASGVWVIDVMAGVAIKEEDPDAPKKTRAPRRPKTAAPAAPVTAAPAAKQGEAK